MSRNDDINSLPHSKWRCHYHIVFAPKYRRQAICGKITLKRYKKRHLQTQAEVKAAGKMTKK